MIAYHYSDDHVVFTSEGETTTVSKLINRLFGRDSAPENVDAWTEGDAACCDALAALRMYDDEHPNTVRFGDDRVVAAHEAVATLNASQARSLGLPAPPRYIFSVGVSGVIGSPDFKLGTHWLQGDRVVSVRRKGAFLETADGEFLIPAIILSAIQLAERFNESTPTLSECWTALAQFRRQFETEDPGLDQAMIPTEENRIEMSEFLRNLKIYTGAALSLRILGDKDEVDFDPIIFNAEAIESAEEEGRPLTESEGALSEQDLDSFLNDDRTGFRSFPDAKGTYLLGSGTYLIADDDLEIALRVVRKMQQAKPSERAAFAINPRAFISNYIEETLGDISGEELDERVSALFQETPEYANRAVEIGLWSPPQLDILPRIWNDWLPETFPLEVGGVLIQVHRDTVETLRERIDDAIEAGISYVEYEGQTIPATKEVRQELAEVIGLERPDEPPERPAEKDEDRDESGPTVIMVHENFVEENWNPNIPPRDVHISEKVPETVRTDLLAHQQEAFKWHIEAWKSGHPGILNADDQGLGKTIQTLAFLAWLQQNMAEGPPEGRRPMLIVAPRGLLSTWRHEHDKHLKGTGLGAYMNVYGSELNKLRKPNMHGRDTDDGQPRLHFEEIGSAIKNGNGHRWWLLTTYETLANFQHSLYTLNFSAVVFDEIQKVKNPKTLSALATRSVKSVFRIGLTGTPMENQVADLWAVMDVIAPGRLRTLEEYLDRYQGADQESMTELHGRLFKSTKSSDDRCYPPIAQRRLKEERIENLPRKDYRFYPMSMPNIQKSAYNEALNNLSDGARGAALSVLHYIRGVSLHPQSPDQVTTDIDTYFSHSARFEATRNILNSIRDRRERVLLFTEDRHMQKRVALWLMSTFGLESVPIINGETSVTKRQKYVEQFQRHLERDEGFDAMILSPRAAGVGLTLTAATHVIHLSRWWNPAVEEQCNDRIYRIGQKYDVTIHMPLAVHPTYREKSFDCVLNNLMNRKKSLARTVLCPPVNTHSDLASIVNGLRDAEPVDVTEIDGYDWQQFEDWVINRARANEDWEVSETPRSGDGGADVVLRHLRRPDVSALVQVKHRSDRDSRVDHKAVEEVIGAGERYNVRNPQLFVITNAGGFSDRARDMASENSVTLLARDHLSLWPNHALA